MVDMAVWRALHVRLLAVGLGHALALAFGYTLLDASTLDARRWLPVALTVSMGEIALCWRYLPENRRPGGELLATFGVANALTLLRGVFVALAAGFLLTRPSGVLSWLPATLCALCGLGDFFDGWLARRTDRQTALGARLDIELDALATAVVAGLAVADGQVPAWYLAVGLARYVFVGALALRRRLSRPTNPLPERASRRYLYAVQFTFSTLALSPSLGPPATALVAVPVAAVFLAGFLRDWLVVTGRLAGHAARETSASKGQ